MAFEPAGYADKLGNRYEGRWVARQLLLLLNEQVRSVTLESVGDDEAGVDLWIERNDGGRKAQQCKAENGSKRHWSLADLKSRGVLGHLRSQLERDSRFEFTLVSGSPAPHLRDLSRSAKDSTGNAESFYRDQIQAGSNDRQAAFSEWCSRLELQEPDAEDRAVAFDLLRRSGFHQFVDTRESREDLKFMARQAVVGDADAVIALIADYAADNLRKPISVSGISQHLRNSGFELRQLFADERIGPRIHELQEDFDDSIRPHLAGNRLIERPEVDEVLKLLENAELPAAIVLHGSAGHGKSGVLYQLTVKLREQGTPFLALRLDRKHPEGSPRQYGKEIGLPESPVNCLAAVSGGNRAVLILDQLDALRWTSSHATEGLEVCKGLLREVRSMQLLGDRVSIVLCCRTFDLEHDPQIRQWLKPTKNFAVEKVAVKELPEASVREFVGSFDVNFDRMTARRRTLLQSVQNLAIWAEVVHSEETSPEFDSGTDLMRAFWKNRRREIEKAGFGTAERDELINRLVDFMESHATLSAPIRLIESEEGLATELQTLNVIHTSKRTVSFCHQSYLDFLIADRVVDKLASGSAAVVEWLGDRRQQSLFRREQLRQLLFLLAEDDPERLSATLERLLNSNSVRFHIKQLAIEAIGQLKPTSALADFVIRLTDSEDWRKHIIHDVLNGNVDWIRAFHDCGRLFDWLLSSKESFENSAVWLLISVAESLPSLLSEALAATRPEDKQELLRGVLRYSKPQFESDDVFEFRLQCLTGDTDPPYISWKVVAGDRPDRALQLVAAFLDNCPSGRRAKRAGHRLDMDGSDDLKAMTRAARRCPKLAVRLLTPILTAVASTKIAERRAWKNRSNTESLAEYPKTRYPKVLLRLMAAAVKSLGRSSPQRFEKLSNRLSGISSRMIQAMLVHGWAAMPDTSADDAINWLLSDTRRLNCGSAKKKPKWCAAASLAERMSPHCSEKLFRRLEQTIFRYRDPEELRRAAYWLKRTREGYFHNGFFAAQRFLLPALGEARRSQEVTSRLGVLLEKFGDNAEAWFVRERWPAGFVGSTLNTKNLNKISDQQWLRVIANRELPRHAESWRQRHGSTGGPIESSIEMFSRDFGLAAKRDPERFGLLALRFPPDAPPDYLSEVLRALQQTKPGNEVPEEQRETWRSASQECVERVLDDVPLPDDSDTRRNFCRLVRDRDDIRPSERVINQLIELTQHPEPEGLAIECDESASEVGIEELQQKAINCVRSLAAIAISSLLYDHREMFARFRPALERLLSDEHPVVRAAMVQVCLPVWNIDRPLAIQWFRSVCENDLRLACGHYAQRICNHGFSKFADQLSPLVETMCHSPVEEIAEHGAKEATARWLFFGLFSALVEKCRSGTEPQRMGVASIVAQFVRDEKYAERCWPILFELCDDPSSEVRSKAGRALHDDRVLNTAASPEFLKTFLATQAFEDDPDILIDALQDHPGSLIPFADLVCDTVDKSVEIIRDPNRKPDRRIPMIDRHLSTVLLRQRLRGRLVSLHEVHR
ncbi:MAG: hypothetical protein ACKVII_23695 [Planctomycetales bacterium]